MSETWLEAIRVACRAALPSDEARQIESTALRQAIDELCGELARVCGATASEENLVLVKRP